MDNIIQVLTPDFIAEEPYEIGYACFEAGRLGLDMDMVTVPELGGDCLVVLEKGTKTPSPEEIWAWFKEDSEIDADYLPLMV